MTNQTRNMKRLSQKRFNQFARGYVTNPGHAAGYDLDQFIQIANPQPHWRILDVATGGGHTALKFAPYVSEVTATDLALQMLAAAREHIAGKGVINIRFKLVDAENLPFAENTFDLVTCRIAPHHFPDIARFVRESTRVLKPGGLLIVQDQVMPEEAETAAYINSFEKERDPSHNFALPESKWRAIFEEAGLTIFHTEQFTKRQNLLKWSQLQSNDAEVTARLFTLLSAAPPAAAKWFEAQQLETDEASFVNHHLLIAGRKGAK